MKPGRNVYLRNFVKFLNTSNMRVGILTFHRAHNYGAVLQCYALQEVIKSMGHEVDVIDYHQPYIEKLYKTEVPFSGYLSRIFNPRAIYGYHKWRSSQIYETSKFTSFVLKYLNTTNPCTFDNVPTDYDVYVIGSDQVWSLYCTGGYDPIFWGQFKHQMDANVIGYSISSNGDFLMELSSDKIFAHFASFADFTFREKVIRDKVASELGVTKNIAVDPTLLTSPKTWESMLNKKWEKKKYIALYQVRANKGEENILMERAEALSKLYNYEIVDLSTKQFGVEDFVSAIAFAQCVLTSSFHATVFSLIFGRPFYSFRLYDGKDDRYVELLDELGLTEHIVDKNSEITSIPNFAQIDINDRLMMLKSESQSFLSKYL